MSQLNADGDHLPAPDGNGHHVSPDHFQEIIGWILRGEVIPFFGAGVNLCNRPLEVSSFEPGRYLPSGRELSDSIAERFKYKWDDPADKKKDDPGRLMRVSWYATTRSNGHRALVHHLHEIFDHNYEATEVHTFFAGLPARLGILGCKHRHQLIVTTNYDDVMEHALRNEGVPYDVVSYVGYSNNPADIGLFRHTPHEGEPEIIYNPEQHPLPIDNDGVLERTIILKIHGTVDRAIWKRSNFVITEDDYINYLARMKKETYLPSRLHLKMLDGIFLFLGYRLSDWNLRVLLHSFGSERMWKTTSTAVMRPGDAKAWEPLYWKEHDIDLIEMDLVQYIKGLEKELAAYSAGVR